MRGRANEAQSSGTQRARWRGQASAATRRAAERGGEARRGGPLGAQRRKVAKSSAQPSTSETSRPSAPERDAQPSSASRRSSATPQTSLRLCASARDKRRRDDHRPLEEPIADTPEQVAQSRRAAERSPQARSSATPQPLGGLASWRETNDAATTTARSKSRSPIPPNRSRRAAERSPQARSSGTSLCASVVRFPTHRSSDSKLLRHQPLAPPQHLLQRRHVPQRRAGRSAQGQGQGRRAPFAEA